MEIGTKVMQIEDGHAHEGIIIATRKNSGVTEAQVRWHKGFTSWEPMVSLDYSDDVA